MSIKLFPWFQPIVDVASGRVVGYEALARMHDATGAVVSAGALFRNSEIPPAQRLEYDRQVRTEALRQFAALASPEQSISLNLSPEWIDSLESCELPPTLQMIREAGVRPEQVIVEITELDGDIERICALAQRYRAEGVRIAYDDFGAGFQQLDRILAFTPDVIKIDMRTFNTLSDAHQKRALMRMVGDVGASLGARVVFEGVETDDELFLALHCNASQIQGFLFSPAVDHFIPADALKPQVEELMAVHLDLAIEETARRQWHAEGIQSELLGLRDLLLTGTEDLATALTAYSPDPDILRFFICDRRGRQISPNWWFSDLQWHSDASVMGANWSWRPYFYQLVGASDYERRILSSSIYIDLASGKRCHTLTLALDSHRILLVDVVEKAQGSRPMSALIACQSDLIPAG